MTQPTAAIILIGNELLSGKVADTNATYLIGRLRELGVRLRRVSIVADASQDIQTEVRFASDMADHVFTSGGIGPTHDDITVESIANGFEVRAVVNPDLEAGLRAHFGDRLTADHLRMARVPEGAHLIHGGKLRFPVICFRNVYILPGVPEIFRDKFESIAERFRGQPMALRSIYINADEGTIAQLLRDVEGQHTVSIGSYPRIDDADHRVRLTVEGTSPLVVDRAADTLIAALRPSRVVRFDPPLTPS